LKWFENSHFEDRRSRDAVRVKVLLLLLLLLMMIAPMMLLRSACRYAT